MSDGDAITLASKLGLFELATFLLALVAVLLALGGVIALVDLRRRAKKFAREEAKVVSAEIAERTAVQYLQAELPKLLDEYRELASHAVRGEQADRIAGAQDETEGA